MKLSVIVPTYNAQSVICDNLKKLFAFLSQYSSVFPFEIIAVDDGSTDDTLVRVSELKKHYPAIRYFAFEKNCGKGAAVKRGVKEARGKIIVFTDADLPYDLTAILKILEEIKAGADIVIGDRTLPRSRAPKPFPFIRKLSGNVFSIFIQIFLLKGYPDTQCGIKGFRATVAKKLFAKLFEERYAFDMELIFLAHRLDYKIKKIPVILCHKGKSQVKLFGDSFDMLASIMRIKKRLRKGVYGLGKEEVAAFGNQKGEI